MYTKMVMLENFTLYLEGIKMKRKVVVYIAMSLDGYIADNNGGIAWLGGQKDNFQGDYGYGEFIESVDTVIMGMNTYNQIVIELSPNQWPYPNIKSYVFTHQAMENNENAEFISSDISKFIIKLKYEEGKNIWICGGANIINQLIDTNLIDEYHLTIMPVILGNGIKLFSDDNPTTLLKVEQVKEINGVVDIVYTHRTE
ncbi:dihydrofolate reductase family protein [Clostridium sporogenes]